MSETQPSTAPADRRFLKLALLRTEDNQVYGKYITPMYNEWLNSADPDVTVELTEFNAKAQQLPPEETWHQFDGFVIPGSLNSAYDDIPWIHTLTACIQRLHQRRMPTLAICFGHQLTAHALGGLVIKNPQGSQVSWREFSLAHPSLPAGTSSLRLRYSHNDVVWEIPQGVGAESLGETAGCKTHGMCIASADSVESCGAGSSGPSSMSSTSSRGVSGAVKRRVHMLTFQGHPEYCSPSGQSAVREVLNAYHAKGFIDETGLAEATRLLDNETDSKRIAQLALAMFEGRLEC
eukprot:GDKI01047360.1.p1 GENE.GDKI01047360.1~~GDKI01047360.1.p1  ORF type:complete len:292 (+),score=76.13 GDKI01047360.1:84-959(+)